MNEILTPFSMSNYVLYTYKIWANSILLPKMVKPWIISLRPVRYFLNIDRFLWLPITWLRKVLWTNYLYIIIFPFLTCLPLDNTEYTVNNILTSSLSLTKPAHDFGGIYTAIFQPCMHSSLTVYGRAGHLWQGPTTTGRNRVLWSVVYDDKLSSWWDFQLLAILFFVALTMTVA